MPTGERNDELSEAQAALRAFDDRFMRRAILLGVIRTAVTATVLVFSLLVVGTIVSGFVQQRGDRDDRMERVIGTAVQVAHPEYRVNVTGCCEVGLLSMSLPLDVTPMGAVWSDTNAEFYTITQNHLGHLSHPRFLPLTPLSSAIGVVGHPDHWDKDGTRRLIDRLPEQLTALAAVAFSEPLTPAEWEAFPVSGHAILLARGEIDDIRPIGWVDNRAPQGELEGVAGFQAWVATLRDSDADNLGRLYLDLDELRAAAADGRVYGFVLGSTPLGELRALLDDRRVGMVEPGEVAFDLIPPEPGQ